MDIYIYHTHHFYTPQYETPTMTILGKPYTLDDFNKLIFSEDKYELPESIFAIFKTIERNIDIPVFTAPTASASTPSHPIKRDVLSRSTEDSYSGSKGERSHYGPKSGQSNHSSRDRDAGKGRGKKESSASSVSSSSSSSSSQAEDWGLMRSFKTTKIEVKTGADKIINDLRIHLNKMSASNYAKQRDTIITEIRQYLESENATHEITAKVSSAIFQIVSTNKFLSELYSDLYIELIREFPLFDVLLQEFIVSFFETIHTIEYVDPDVDYDEFCRITKANDRRKSTTTFIANTMKKGAVPAQTVMDLLTGFINAANSNIRTPNRAFHAEEITENIFILVSLCFSELRNQPEWEAVFGIVQDLSKQKIDETCPSMTNRVLFKFMDILDCAKSPVAKR